MPGADDSQYLENDTQALPVQAYIDWYPLDQNAMGKWNASAYSRFDPNPRHGRIAYTHGLGADQPLSVLRVGLNRYYPATYPETGGQGVSFAPFASMPLTDWRGQVDGTLHPSGGKQHCQTFSGTTRCTSIAKPRGWSAYGQEDPSMLEWHGTLLTGKQDATGTLYRRARYLDPRTGRFTQEDPTGLAGGVNLYGFAGGDPINFADPSGLIRMPRLPKWVPLAAFAVTFGAAGLGPMSFGDALWGSTKAFGAMAIGSAAAAGAEAAVSGKSFEDAFFRNFGYSSAFLAGGAAVAYAIGGGPEAVGANGLFNGYVVSSKTIGVAGGLTLGTATVLNGVGRDEFDPMLFNTIGVHERGHTVQFILLSATGRNPWGGYLALGVLGALTPRDANGRPRWENFPGQLWEDLATLLGGIA